ncbi:hypothetical protein E1180_07565 [Roseibium denhamense]|nr:hypothetical protein [Roseibium denhamense]
MIICDVDEVILHMIKHLEAFLAGQNLTFLCHEYRLTGNIAEVGASAPLKELKVKKLLQNFFDEICHQQELVEGASEALSGLAENWDIVLLTNLPGGHNKPAREALLRQFGVPFPVVTNEGPKGGAVAALASHSTGPVVFIDDSPSNHASVNASLPASTQVQFIADERFKASMTKADHVALLTSDWQQTSAFIGSILQREAG